MVTYLFLGCDGRWRWHICMVQKTSHQNISVKKSRFKLKLQSSKEGIKSETFRKCDQSTKVHKILADLASFLMILTLP